MTCPPFAGCATSRWLRLLRSARPGGRSFLVFIVFDFAVENEAFHHRGPAEFLAHLVHRTLRLHGARRALIDEIGGVVFPSEHMRLLIEAAHAGKSLLEVDVYDGSESGEKIYHSLSVIGHRIAPDKAPDDAAAEKDTLAGLARWPVTISYFDQSAKKADDQPTEQTPVYAISFEMYENGISRALRLDYGDFVIDGTMSSLDIKPVKACK